jgi:flagellar protein FlbD
MIPVHRLTHPEQPIWINCDLIATIEATPDTVVSLTSAAKVLVIESPEEVVELICGWKARVLAVALANPEESRLSLVPRADGPQAGN